MSTFLWCWPNLTRGRRSLVRSVKHSGGGTVASLNRSGFGFSVCSGRYGSRAGPSGSHSRVEGQVV